MAKTIYDISWADILPEAIKSDSSAKSIANAVTSELRAISRSIAECVILARLDELPEELLDLLAWQYHVDFYEPIGMDINKKRILIRQSIDWHRHKGTPWAVEQVVKAAIADAKVEEWFNYGGDPYTFRIKITGYISSKDAYDNLITAINSIKNTRSHLDEILVTREKTLPIYAGFLQSISGGSAIRLKPPELDQNHTIYAGMAQSITGYSSIRLKRAPDQSFLQSLGAGMSKGGWIKIRHEASDLPVLEHLETGVNFCTGTALSAVGIRKVKLPELPSLVTRATFGIAQTLTGKQEIRSTMVQKEQYGFLAGIALCKSGGLTIKIKGE